jgi:hypothetical protein
VSETSETELKNLCPDRLGVRNFPIGQSKMPFIGIRYLTEKGFQIRFCGKDFLAASKVVEFDPVPVSSLYPHSTPSPHGPSRRTARSQFGGCGQIDCIVNHFNYSLKTKTL